MDPDLILADLLQTLIEALQFEPFLDHIDLDQETADEMRREAEGLERALTSPFKTH